MPASPILVSSSQGPQEESWARDALGEGDTPLKEILKLVKEEKDPFPSYIENVGTDGPAVELIKML